MENSKEMSNWLHDFGLDHPLVIAGPCSAETEDQVLKIAHELKDTDVKLSVIARGISIGDELEYADEVTLGRSILNRTPYENSLVQ